MLSNRVLKLILTASLSCCMLIAFAGCGDQTSSTGSDDQETTAVSEETKAEETTEATQPASSDDYDIAEGLEINEIDEDTLELKGNGFTLTMPNTGTWSYRENENTHQSLDLYYLTADETGYDGGFLTIMAMDLDDTSYEDFPAYTIAGENAKLGKRFIAMFATDVRFDPEDATQANEYKFLSDYVHTIDASSPSSPFHVDE